MLLRILYSDRSECVLGIAYRLRIRTLNTPHHHLHRLHHHNSKRLDRSLGWKGKRRKPAMISPLKSANLYPWTSRDTCNKQCPKYQSLLLWLLWMTRTGREIKKQKTKCLSDTSPLCSYQKIYLFFIQSCTTQSTILLGYQFRPTPRPSSHLCTL